MIALRIIARLLDYPQQDFVDHQQEILDALAQANELDAHQHQFLAQFIQQAAARPLLDRQAEYSELFDRGRATSLLLFEHVHGESRDRGQAMVDLLAQYRADGLELNAKELPDFLPLYLEYLAQGDQSRIRRGLQDIAPILALLAARLSQRQSDYAPLFPLLLALSGSSADPQSLQTQVAQEARDDTPAALDAVWEEEQVAFIAQMNPGGGGCESAQKSHPAAAVMPQYLDISAVTMAAKGE
ncbi:nitrate reductase molybdenum cofactor assembly chaperone [Erwinia persicina]|uniref:nitrate reductase molybdenum cofactor assembly chaperone n=1 Tax=Erwinia persicina TaxID=55211 RepID=UPI0017844E03|nr:nitrate reductase molybdenum cofactor assembly chaperone [Erwinia persicina]MBD8162488.1 nitrate reductase molybdenum cofactor assembly chaperone [Erwinia persicina]MBD8214868.1 nitrate reductase molybdenum cofactor assembly chaperone [Erwinia persicina]